MVIPCRIPSRPSEPLVYRTAWSNRTKAVMLGLGLCLAFYTVGKWWKVYRYRVPDCGASVCMADFPTFYAQATLVWQDRAGLYDLDKQLASQRKIAPTEHVLPFVYPPSTAMLMAPLALLPFDSAFIAVTLLNVLLVGASLRQLKNHLNLGRDQWQWLMLFAICNLGVHATLYNGQTSALVLYLLTRCVLAQKQRPDYRAGLWIGLLSIKPQFLPVPHLALWMRGNHLGFFVGAALSTSLIIGGFVFIGADASQQYLQLAQRMSTITEDWWNQWRSMHNLRALTTYWLPVNLQAWAWWVGSLLVAVLTVTANLRVRDARDGFSSGWIINVLALLILTPHLFTHDLSLLIVPCALFLDRLVDPVPIAAGIGLVALGALPMLNNVFPTITAVALVVLFTWNCQRALSKAIRN